MSGVTGAPAGRHISQIPTLPVPSIVTPNVLDSEAGVAPPAAVSGAAAATISSAVAESAAVTPNVSCTEPADTASETLATGTSTSCAKAAITLSRFTVPAA